MLKPHGYAVSSETDAKQDPGQNFQPLYGTNQCGDDLHDPRDIEEYLPYEEAPQSRDVTPLSDPALENGEEYFDENPELETAEDHNHRGAVPYEYADDGA